MENTLLQLIEPRDEFRQILYEKNITSIYQPIVSLADGLPFGYEALTRGPKNSYFHSPINLFHFAESQDLLFPIEKMARESAIKNCSSFMKNNEKLFLNFSPKIINDPSFSPGITAALLKKYGFSPNDVVFEITERQAIHDFKTFRKALNHYRDQGFLIAIDDAGAGYSSAQAISELAPDFIKIDRSIVDGVHNSDVKEKILEAFVSIAIKCNSKVIVEGIEYEEDLIKAYELGADYAQGFLLARPDNPIQSINPIAVDCILKCLNTTPKYQISNLALPVKTVNINGYSQKVTEYFMNNSKPHTVVILQNEKPIGIVKRHEWLSKCTNVLRKPLVVEHTATIISIANRVLNRDDSAVYDDIILTNNGTILGIVTVKDLLKFFLEA